MASSNEIWQILVALSAKKINFKQLIWLLSISLQSNSFIKWGLNTIIVTNSGSMNAKLTYQRFDAAKPFPASIFSIL